MTHSVGYSCSLRKARQKRQFAAELTADVWVSGYRGLTQNVKREETIFRDFHKV